MCYATCNKIALCKQAYLCDMRLLHAVDRRKVEIKKTFLRQSHVAIMQARLHSVILTHIAWSHVFVASCKRDLTNCANCAII